MNMYDIAVQESKKRRGNMIDIPAPPSEPVQVDPYSDEYIQQSMQDLNMATLDDMALKPAQPKPKKQTPFQEHVQEVLNNSAKAGEQERQGLTPIRENFLQTLALLENDKKDGWSKSESIWRPHFSPEQGRKTLAYGHKLTEEEEKTGELYIGGTAYDIDKGIPDDKAWQLLREDFDKSFRRAKKTFGTAWEHLDPRVKMLASEINFNVTGGLEGFPSFQQLAKDVGNPSGSLQEIGRTYSYTDEKTGKKVTKHLEKRVTALANWFKNYKE